MVNAAENFGRQENLSPVLNPTMAKDLDKQLKLSHKLVDVVDRTNGNTFATLLRHCVEKPESSYAHVRKFAKKKEDKKFQQNVYVTFKPEEFFYLLYVMSSVTDEVTAN